MHILDVISSVLGNQNAPKSLAAGASAPDPTGESLITALPRPLEWKQAN